jgi:hypothetical protein
MILLTIRLVERWFVTTAPAGDVFRPWYIAS